MSGWVGGNQEEGDHSMGKENRKIISARYAFAQEREREGVKDRRGLSPFLHPRLRTPLLGRSASQTSLHDESARTRWCPLDPCWIYWRESKKFGPFSWRVLPPLSYSFQLQAACIPAGQGLVMCSTVMQQHEDTIICILDEGGWSMSQKVQQASERGW